VLFINVLYAVACVILNFPPESIKCCHYTNYGKNAVTHRGPILWNAVIAQDKDFADTNCKDLAKEIHSTDIFKELTFKETSVTTANFRCTDFNYI